MATFVGTGGNDVYAGTPADDIIDGAAGNDTLSGADGDDVIIGGIGDDVLSGEEGSDFLYPDTGNDTMNGGNGWDYVFYSSALSGLTADLLNWNINTGDAAGDVYASIEVLVGSNFDDSLLGDANRNYLYGNSGSDTLYGREGDDVLIGGDGNDILVGGLGKDFLYGGDGDDHLYPGVSHDYSSRGSGQNFISGGAGYDFVHYDNLGVGIYTNLSGPFITGNPDWLETGDSYLGVEGIVGTSFRDILIGNGGDNWIYGLGGDDLIDAGSSFSAIGVHFIGGDGSDTIQGNAGDDWIYGDDGSDILRSYEGNDHAFGGAGNDRFEMNGDGVADWYDGGDGDDVFIAWNGTSFTGDIFIGGNGSDTIDISLGPVQGYVLDLVDPSQSSSVYTGASFHSLENIKGTMLSDSLRGNALDNLIDGGVGDGADWLYGREGNDTLLGGDGSDVLFGNGGNDILTGGSSGDRFYFTAGDGNDQITDFSTSVDFIYLSASTGLTNFAQVQTNSSQVGADVFINLGGGDSLTLLGVNLSTLSSDGFGFYV